MAVNVEELILGADTEGLRDAADDYDRLGDRAERAENDVTRSARGMDTSIRRMAAGAISALGGMVAGYVSLQGAAAALNQARRFDEAFAETSTLIQGTTSELKLLEDGSKSLANLYGTSAIAQVQAYYQAISAGADGVAGATDVLNAANRLAIGGITDVSTGVDALTTAVNAYGPSVLNASDASDAMFVAMKAGKTTIGELSASLGNIIPIAASVGVEFDEVVGGIAALTTQGLTTAAATTQLRQVIASVIRPTQEAKDAAAALNLQFDAQALASKGLADFLEDVIEKTGGSSDEMAKLFGSVEALGAALAFAGGGGEAFNDIMVEMENKLGATDAAVSKIEESLSKRLNNSLHRLSNLGLEVGQVLLGVAVPALETTVDVIQLLSDNASVLAPVLLAVSTALVVPTLVAGATAILSMGAAAASAAISFGYAVAAIGGATTATAALSAAVSLLVTPFTALVAVVGLATAAMVLLRDDTDTAALAAESQADALGSLDEALIAVNRSSGMASSQARQIMVDHYNAALAVAEHARETAALTLEQFKASQETFNPFDGPGLDDLRQVRDNLIEANARVEALKNRMSEFGATTNEAGQVIDENTGRIIRTTQEVERLHALQIQFMGEDRQRSAEAISEANEILSQYRMQAEMQQLINVYGAESVQVAEERHRREREVVEAQVDSLDVAQSIKDEILAAVDATHQSEVATMAWEQRMSGVAAQINAIGNALSQMGSSAINTAANYAEIEALEAGASVQEATHSRTIEQINLEKEARLSATDSIIEQMVIRGEAAQRVAEVESQAALTAARAAANARDITPSGGGGGGSSGSATNETMNERNRLMEEGQRITEALRTEQEKYNEAVEQADRLLQVGALSTEAYNQHVANLSEELAEAEFGQAIDGITRISDGMIDAVVNGDNLLDSFKNMLAQMAIEAIKADIGGLISGFFGGKGVTGGGSGILGLGSFIGGARADGGPVRAGVPYLVNENTANSEIMVPSQSGAVLNVPQAQEAFMKSMTENGSGKPVAPNVNNNIRNIVVSPQSVSDYLSTPEGEQAVINIIDARG